MGVQVSQHDGGLALFTPTAHTSRVALLLHVEVLPPVVRRVEQENYTFT